MTAIIEVDNNEEDLRDNHQIQKQYESSKILRYTDENGDDVIKTTTTKITTTKTVKYSAIMI